MPAHFAPIGRKRGISMNRQEAAGWLQREKLEWLPLRVTQGARMVGNARHAGRFGVLLTLINQDVAIDCGPAAKVEDGVITTTKVLLRHSKRPK